MNILIMCQGQQRRLPHLAIPKHLLEVRKGEPILVRTLRLLAEHVGGTSGSPVVVFGPPALEHALSLGVDAGLRIPLLAQIPDPGVCIVDGMLAARAAWAEEDPARAATGSVPSFEPAVGWARRPGRTVILLGDVVWSRDAMAALLTDPRPVVFAGTPVLSFSQGEVFALAFDNPQEMDKLCRTCPCRVDGSRVRSFRQQQGGHMRRLLWHLQDQRHLRLPGRTRQTWHPDVYLPIEDWTNDIDTQADVGKLRDLAHHAETEELALSHAAVTAL